MHDSREPARVTDPPSRLRAWHRHRNRFGAMYDTSLEPTLLVPRLPPDDPVPVRQLPRSFAPGRITRWPWIVLALAAFALAAAEPVDLSASQRSVERSVLANQLLHDLGH